MKFFLVFLLMSIPSNLIVAMSLGTHKRKFDSSAQATFVIKKRKHMNKAEQEQFLSSLVYNRLSAICDFIKTYHIDLNRPLFSKSTPLHIAIQKGHLNLVKELIEQHQVECSTNYEGHFHTAVNHGRTPIVDYLIRRFSIHVDRPLDPQSLKTALHIAFEKKYLPLIKTLIENHNASTAIADEKGLTPLAYLACFDVTQKKVMEIFEYLFEKTNHFDVDTWVCNKSGSTLLHEAIKHNNIDLIKLLVEKYQANIEALDYNFRTPLALAQQVGNKDSIDYLQGYFS